MNSISSMSTFHDEKNMEKLNGEKNYLEKQLVEYKFKYTEIFAKLNDLETEYEKAQLKIEVRILLHQQLNQKIIEKDVSIKNLVTQKESLKYNSILHYSSNNCKSKPMTERNIRRHDIIEFKKDPLQEVTVVEDYINTDPGYVFKEDTPKTERRPIHSKSSSFYRYFKTLFKGEE